MLLGQIKNNLGLPSLKRSMDKILGAMNLEGKIALLFSLPSI
jgi:hypothetical protein